MLSFDYKERLNLDELNEKINNVNNFEDNAFSLDNIINKKIEEWIKTKI